MNLRIAHSALIVLFAFGCEEAPPERTTPPVRVEAKSSTGVCEHGLPQDLCTKCNPALGHVFQAKGDWCEDHGFPQSICPVCDPDAAARALEAREEAEAAASTDRPSVGEIEGRVVRFASPEIEAQAGIETVAAVKAATSSDVACSARIEYDADEVADVRAIVPGIVREVAVELGARVKAGDPLFELESTQIGDIQATLQNARERVRTAEANLARQRELHEDAIASARQVELAERELASARAAARSANATLRMAGAARSAPTGKYVLRSPIDGTVVRRPAVKGILATEETSLATVADSSQMWAMCDIPEQDASAVKEGDVMQLDLGRGRVVTGPISWISPEVDPRTRMVVARAELDNSEGRLRANQFANARIATGDAGSAVLVPRESIQRVEGYDVVFLRASAGTYLPRVVQRGPDGELVAIEGKVSPGDAIVTVGAVLLRTEVLPGSIGAGCCEVEPRSDR